MFLLFRINFGLNGCGRKDTTQNTNYESFVIESSLYCMFRFFVIESVSYGLNITQLLVDL
ncbi:hypothetical protein HanRHA438_Chr06g0282781 [Helianthus annuus]|nr:hypothetical protein HanIR_Chr06g0294191 [Helianthus annuus]KAJ0913187.1 hypothetical protein HanRHA438_Chr06g0282781 [Helianthus annuus]